LRNDLNLISVSLINQNLNVSDSRNVVQIAENYYGRGTEHFEIFKSTLENLSSNSESGRFIDSGELTKFQQEQINEIIQLTGELENLEEITDFLDKRFDNYANADLSDNDKDFLLTFVTVYEEGMTFVLNNQDLFIQSQSPSARWRGRRVVECAGSSIGLIASYAGLFALTAATGEVALVATVTGAILAPTMFGLGYFG